MTNHDAAVLGIRLAALFAGYQAVEYLSMAGLFSIQSANMPEHPRHLFVGVLYLLPSALLLAAAFWLFQKAPAFAGHFLPDSHNEASVSPSGNSAIAVGFGITGLAGLILSVPRLIPPIITLLARDDPPSTKKAFLLSILPQFAGTLAQTILSFAILVKSRALAEWWQRKQEY